VETLWELKETPATTHFITGIEFLPVQCVNIKPGQELRELLE
jgi:hypothetical protein